MAKNKGADLVNALELLLDFTKTIPEFCIALDHSKDNVEVLWKEDVFNIEPSEFPRLIECILYIKSKEMTY